MKAEIRKRIKQFVSNYQELNHTKPDGMNLWLGLHPQRTLFFYDKSCLSCVKRCVKKALLQDSFDRHKCYEMCLINEDHYRDVGNADVCGKCVVEVPCAWKNPVREKMGV